MLLAQLLKLRSISGTFWMSFSLMCLPAPQPKGIHALLTCTVLLSPRVSFPHPRPRRCSKAWSCNMQCDIMRPETGSCSKTSPSSPTTPFLPNVTCWSWDVSSTRRPKREDELTSQPLQQWPHHHPPIHADTLSTYPCCHNCSYSHPHVIAQPRNCHATIVVILATTLPYVSARDPSTSATLPSEVITVVEATEVPEVPGTTNHATAATVPDAEESTLATPQADSHASTAPLVASPTALPTVPPAVHLLISLTDFVASVSPCHTPRTAWRSSQQVVSKPHLTPKVPCWLRECLMAKSHSTCSSSYQPRMVQRWWLWRSTLVLRIPLSRYWNLFPQKVDETRSPKLNLLSPTAHTWISHDGKPKPFLGTS